MKKPESLDQQWKAFAARVLPLGVSVIQRQEMEGAFKAGCASILLEMRGPVADLPEEAGVRTLERWTQEYKDFISARVRNWGSENRAMS